MLRRTRVYCVDDGIGEGGHISKAQVDALTGEWMYGVGGISESQPPLSLRSLGGG
jgi:hypothetical protein